MAKLFVIVGSKMGASCSCDCNPCPCCDCNSCCNSCSCWAECCPCCQCCCDNQYGVNVVDHPGVIVVDQPTLR
ncbi:jg21383 [Pararge aegeria aegeria]|uniref:Jg21383 protein n=1 Tax=Pararge aegeria aegeria TaxID=348720 RepID=A0A8S4S1P5_9NEOP|nr:jg21383 [Pararge aegeria aegeria]